jgi:phage terminase large subunit
VWIDKVNPDAVFCDAGNGTGVIDRLREMGYKVHEVWFGSKAEDPEWANKRTEIWARMREWLNGSCIDQSQELMDDLAGPEYKFQGSSDRIMLESKEEMKKRGLASPDHGDALAVTFALKVARKDLSTSRARQTARVAKDVDYPVF